MTKLTKCFKWASTSWIKKKKKKKVICLQSYSVYKWTSGPIRVEYALIKEEFRKNIFKQIISDNLIVDWNVYYEKFVEDLKSKTRNVGTKMA